MSRFYNPVKIVINPIDEIERVLIELGSPMKNIVLLTRGRDFLSSPAAQTLMECLEKFDVTHLQVDIANPDVEDLFAYYTEIKNIDFQCMIGIGGGTILDLSKSLCALKQMDIGTTDDLRLVIEQKSYVENENIVPWIGIPTTSGTGSEVTCWATIWDQSRGMKLSIESEKLYAHTAIIDASLTTTLPQKITASTGLDALCHATEAYWSKNSNELSRVYALEAIKRIVGSLEKVLDRPNDLALRQEMALGSLYAGLAFSNTRTTACHSISYPLTLHLGIAHGVATSVTLAPVMALNLETIIEKEKLFAAFGVTNCDGVKEFIHLIYKKAGFASTLKEYHASPAIIETIVKNAFAKGRMDNNPVTLTEEDVSSILMSIF